MVKLLERQRDLNFYREILDRYDSEIKAMRSERNPGQIRSRKGSLVEFIAVKLVEMSWEELGNSPYRLRIDGNHKKIPVYHNGDVYYLSQDKHVYVDGRFVLSIECKSYTEVAMYKRILVDSYLLKRQYPHLSFVLLQLESMLGGDYATELRPKGSPSVRVLNSIFPDLKIHIITLLDGERNIKRPIHKEEYYKPLKVERLNEALRIFKSILKKYSGNLKLSRLSDFY